MESILVIDDDPFIRDGIGEMLGYEGYKPLKAEDGQEGIKIAEAQLPDLIICDVMMPKVNGYQVLIALRSQPATANIPFIFLTARSAWTDVRRGMDLGADDYLPKPYTRDQLITAVVARLEKRRKLDRWYKRWFDDLRGNLVSMLPHELRTPLTGILGYAELMVWDADNLDTAQVREMASEIAIAGQRLHHVVENYLLYAQTELMRHDAQMAQRLLDQSVDMPDEYIRQVTDLTASRLGRDHDVAVIRADSQAVSVATESLKKILEELIDNAFKFSKTGTPVEVSGVIRDDLYIIQIKDRGRGMTADQVQRIGAYTQFDRKMYEQQGLGLGLILSKRLAELHGGQLMINSAVNQGTTVTVELPLASPTDPSDHE